MPVPFHGCRKTVRIRSGRIIVFHRFFYLHGDQAILATGLSAILAALGVAATF